MTFEKAFEEFAKKSVKNGMLSMRTINAYEGEYKRFLEKTEFVQKCVTEITERDMVRLMRSLVLPKGSIEQKRFNAVKTILRHVFGYVYMDVGLDCIDVKSVFNRTKFPSDWFKPPKKEAKRQVFYKNELSCIKNELSDTDNLREMGILLALTTGLRIGELCVLQRSEVKDDYIKIVRSEHRAYYGQEYRYFVGLPKKNKERIVILSEEAKNVVNKILKKGASDWLFEDNGTWVKSYKFSYTLHALCKRLNVPVLSFHKLRKTWTSVVLSQGVPEKVVQMQLGHSDITTTRQSYYYNVYDMSDRVGFLKDVKIG